MPNEALIRMASVEASEAEIESACRLAGWDDHDRQRAIPSAPSSRRRPMPVVAVPGTYRDPDVPSELAGLEADDILDSARYALASLSTPIVHERRFTLLPPALPDDAFEAALRRVPCPPAGAVRFQPRVSHMVHDAPAADSTSDAALTRAVVGETPAPKKRGGGFASMTKEKRQEIARKGGQAAHASGTAHRFSSDEARAAGVKGGNAPHVRRGPAPARLVLPVPDPDTSMNIEG